MQVLVVEVDEDTGGQDVCGTVTTQFGNPAPRHGYKIIELDEENNAESW